MPGDESYRKRYIFTIDEDTEINGDWNFLSITRALAEGCGKARLVRKAGSNLYYVFTEKPIPSGLRSELETGGVTIIDYKDPRLN